MVLATKCGGKICLLTLIEHCGVCGEALGLLKSYLSIKEFKVVANGVASALKSYYAGVPQGGIWSPTFWAFHIREHTNVVIHCLLSK